MLKKILIGVGVLVVILAIAFVYLNNRNRTLSPPGSTSLENRGLSVTIDYSRPSVRNRVIFGSEAEGALQPYGQYWRLGANEPTLLTVNRDFSFNGIAVKAGAYDMYAIPYEDGFELRLNGAERGWGYSEPDYSQDIAKTKVSYAIAVAPTEQFTINTEAKGAGINIVFLWADRRWEVPVQ